MGVMPLCGSSLWDYYTFMNRKGPDQTADMCRLVLAFTVCHWHRHPFFHFVTAPDKRLFFFFFF